MMSLIAPIAVPLLAAAVSLVFSSRWLSVAAGLSILVSGGVLATGPVTFGLLRADALTAWMLIAVGAVATIACWAAPETDSRRYHSLTQLFLACMSLAVLAANLGVLWIAIEATTIVTAFLVGHNRTRQSLEAAWKYVVLCSVGIAIAFLGTVCVYAASVAAGADGITALDWTHLSAHTSTLDPDLMRLAAGLILLGFGTKAGLAPMHSWLPDAHSQAPAAVSALMSGVLLSVAFYAIIRYKVIIDQVLGVGYTRALLLVGALASLVVAAALLLAQRDYKRMLAYSSIEHMGLIALATAIGGELALAAALLHILGHGLAKAVAFSASGRILQLTGSHRIADVRGLAAGSPALAGVFGASLIALLGFPPFSLFASELGVARAGLDAGAGWVVGAAFALILVAFAAIGRHAIGMLLGPASEGARLRGGSPLIVGLLATVALGVWLGPLQPLLDAAASVASGGGAR